MDTGQQIFHIPTSASPPHGLLCLRNQFLVASQIHKQGSCGGGAIFIWPLNKPQSPLRSYPMESIGPVCCTKDGVYLAGGAPSGNAYLWEVTNGRLLKTWRAHHKSLNSMVFSDDDSLLISGSDDGMIHVLSMISGSITALAFCKLGLLSTSEDCTACLWDVATWAIIRRFHHKKGAITNLVVIPQSSLLSVPNRQRISNRSRVSLLDKYPQPATLSEGMPAHLFTCCSPKDHHTSIDFQRTNSMNQQILDLEQGWTPAAIQMKVETSVENRMWATRMTKHVMEMNKHLQSRLLDLMQFRLLWPPEVDSRTTRKKKKLKVESPPLQGEEQPLSQG
ncbi:hypothetical protein L1049_027748 [Liquidambar formosana]|uniref:Protein ROOT INITIATION DEFECTIVE 3-like n=1 Tax=Liquidambar formosana TaxID=63359 RepID=A0AAP0RJB1_LIQFO